MCIHDGALLADAARVRRYTEQQYLRTPAEMSQLFADLPEALENSVEIARRCTLELPLGESHLPEFPVPEGSTPHVYLREQARAGLEQRLGSRQVGELQLKGYRQRLESELETICAMGFAGYFLIVADFIRWSRDQRHSRRAGPRLGRRLPGRLVPAASPISIRSSTTCCSSASSIPSASRCPTSTSTSACRAAIA